MPKKIEELGGKYNLEEKKPWILEPKYFFIIVFIVTILTALALDIAISSSKKEILTCGDGTLHGFCSLRKPYFCDNGTLVEKASICGCNENLERKGDSCVNNYYMTEPKNLNFKYFIDGKQKEISFLAYKGIKDYVGNLSRIISYDESGVPTRADFKKRSINEELQLEFLNPLIVAIQNSEKTPENQLRAAVSIVQNIPYNFSSEKILIEGIEVNYSRYPYEVIYENAGICGEKTTLLALILKEMGYDVVIFYNKKENHEAVGVKCPVEYSYKNTGYCFIETSGPAIISDSSIEYIGGIKLESYPEIIPISYGKSLPKNLREYKDAKFMERFRSGDFLLFKNSKYNSLKEKYGLTENYYIE
ncbi:MAG: hypothetical protein KatS3mg001_226 [Candidatus Pacearchaeota archaeon]|nr:MAG: hypothetical protein KatS3mg001_226 [Candidatus Pacearchaeota archaeon]